MKLKSFPFFLPVMMLLLPFLSCSKDGGGGGSNNSYPKTVSIEYKVTATAGGVTTLNSIVYSNETGGNDSYTNVALPYSKKFNRRVNLNDIIGFSVLHTNGGSGVPFSLKLEILVDNAVVESQTFSTNSSLTESMAHLFR